MVLDRISIDSDWIESYRNKLITNGHRERLSIAFAANKGKIPPNITSLYLKFWMDLNRI
ncbi:hypothetical protein ES702_06279 [subsurface metagenome]